MDEEQEQNSLYEKALALIDALEQEAQPNYYESEMLIEMCEALIDLDGFEQAEKIAQYGLSVFPKAADFYRIKALVSSLIETVEVALEHINTSLGLDNTNGNAWLLKAGILDLMDKPLEAIDCLEFAEDLGIDRDEILLQKAKFYLHAENALMCKMTLETLLSQTIEFEDTFLDLYLLIQGMGDFEYGATILQHYTKMDPLAALAWHFLGDCYEANGQSLEALEAYDMSIALEGQFESSYISKGMIYMNEYAFLDALETFKSMIARCGESATAFFLVGECYRKNAQHVLARKYLNKCLKLEQSYALAWNALARSFVDTQEHEKALGYMKKALKLSPDDAFIRFDFANLLLELQEYTDALKLLEEGFKIDAEYPPFHTLYAEIMFSKGEREKAVKYLQKLDLQLIDDAYYHYKVAAYLYALGDTQGCMEAAQRGLELNHDLHTAIFESYPPARDYPPLISLIDLYDLDPEE
jgi:tetratricopeptide (TPR) repeat protein